MSGNGKTSVSPNKVLAAILIVEGVCCAAILVSTGLAKAPDAYWVALGIAAAILCLGAFSLAAVKLMRMER